MKRWVYHKGRWPTEEENPKIDAFLEEIWAACEKHGLAIGHQDAHGAFEIHELKTEDDHLKKWLFSANDETERDK